MKELTLFDKQSETISKIHHEGDMVSLTDLWREVGSPANKEPKDWFKRDAATELIETISIMLKVQKMHLWKTKRGKTGGGTWAHKNVALAYAK